MTTPLVYQFDPTAVNHANLVVDEVHNVILNESKIIVLANGCFYIDGCIVKNGLTNAVLTAGTDYKFRGFDPELTAETGFEVASGIYFPAYVGSVKVTAQMVGGYQSLNSLIAKQLAEAITDLNTNLTTDWNAIANKPDTYAPAPHIQSAITDLNDLYRLRDKMDELKESIIGKRSVVNSNQQLAEKINRLLYIIGSFKNQVNEAITLANSNFAGKEDVSNKKDDLSNPLNINNNFYPTTQAVITYAEGIIATYLGIAGEPIPYARGIEFSLLDVSKQISKDGFIYGLVDDQVGLGTDNLPFTTVGIWEENGIDYPWFGGLLPGSHATLSNDGTTLTTDGTVTNLTAGGTLEVIGGYSESGNILVNETWDYLAPERNWFNIGSGSRTTKILSHLDNNYTNAVGNITNFWIDSNYNFVTGSKFGTRAAENQSAAGATSYITNNTGNPSAVAALAGINMDQSWTLDMWRKHVPPAAASVNGLFTLVYYTSDGGGFRFISLSIARDIPNNGDYNFVISFHDTAGGVDNHITIPVSSFITNAPNIANVAYTTATWYHFEMMYDDTDGKITLYINGYGVETIDVSSYFSTVIPLSGLNTVRIGASFIRNYTGWISSWAYSKTYNSIAKISYDEFRFTQGILHNTLTFTPPVIAGVPETVTGTSFELRNNLSAAAAFHPIYFRMSHLSALPDTGTNTLVGYGDYDNPPGKGLFIGFAGDGTNLYISGIRSDAGGIQTVLSTKVASATNLWKKAGLIWLDRTNGSATDCRICFGYIDDSAGQIITEYISPVVVTAKGDLEFERLAFTSDLSSLTFDYYEESKLGGSLFIFKPDYVYGTISGGVNYAGAPSSVYGTGGDIYILKFIESLMITNINGDGDNFKIVNLYADEILLDLTDNPESTLTSQNVEQALIEIEARINDVLLPDWDTPIPYSRGISFTSEENRKAIDRNGIVYKADLNDTPFTTTGSWTGVDKDFPAFLNVTGTTELSQYTTQWNSKDYTDEDLIAIADPVLMSEIAPYIPTAPSSLYNTLVLSHFNTSGYKREEYNNDTNWWSHTVGYVGLVGQNVWSDDNLLHVFGDSGVEFKSAGVSTVNLSRAIGVGGFPNLYALPQWGIDFWFNPGYWHRVQNGVFSIENGANSGIYIGFDNIGRLTIRRKFTAAYSLYDVYDLPSDGHTGIQQYESLYIAIAKTSATVITVRVISKTRDLLLSASITTLYNGAVLPDISAGTAYVGRAYVGNTYYGIYHGLVDELRVTDYANMMTGYDHPLGEDTVKTTAQAFADPFKIMRLNFGKTVGNIPLTTLNKFIDIGYKVTNSNVPATIGDEIFIRMIGDGANIDISTKLYDISGNTTTTFGSTNDWTSLVNLFKDINTYYEPILFFDRYNNAAGDFPLKLQFFDSSGNVESGLNYSSGNITGIKANYIDQNSTIQFFIRTNISDLIADLWNGLPLDTLEKGFLLPSVPNVVIPGFPTSYYTYLPYEITLGADFSKFVSTGANAAEIVFNNEGTSTSGNNVDMVLRDLLSRTDALAYKYRVLGVPKRQCMVSGPIDANGNASFLSQQSASEVRTNTTTITNKPLVFTFGAGWDNRGPVDYLIEFTTYNSEYLAWTGLSTGLNVVNYLYVELDIITGDLTTGFTTTQPSYSLITPAGSAGLCWYPTDHRGPMQVWDGTAWQYKTRLFVGVTIGNGTNAVPFSSPYLGKFYWKDVATINTTTTNDFTKSVNDYIYCGRQNKCTKLLLEVQTASAPWVVGDIIDLANSEYYRDIGNSSGTDEVFTTYNTASGIVISRYNSGNASAIEFARTNTSSQTIIGYLIAMIERDF